MRITPSGEAGRHRPAKLQYAYRYYCPDCFGDADSQGCFGGRVELDDGRYDTPDEADNAGWDWQGDAPYSHYVVCIEEGGRESSMEWDEGTEEWRRSDGRFVPEPGPGRISQ